jgi:phospholipase C
MCQQGWPLSHCSKSGDGGGNDDHPHADIRNGEAFLAKVFKALTEGPGRGNTLADH